MRKINKLLCSHSHHLVEILFMIYFGSFAFLVTQSFKKLFDLFFLFCHLFIKIILLFL